MSFAEVMTRALARKFAGAAGSGCKTREKRFYPQVLSLSRNVSRLHKRRRLDHLASGSP
jgi:hypothetical protein